MVNLGNSLRRGGGQGGFKSNYNHMKSSLPEADRHDKNVTHWDDYPKCEILPMKYRDRLYGR